MANPARSPPLPTAVAQPSQQQQQHMVAPGTAQGGGFNKASLYVGDLDVAVTEAQLFDVFSPLGTVLSVRVCRDLHRRVSLGYAYINYSSHQEASRALEVLNFTPINGKSVRIMFSHRDPSIRKSGYANVFIKNLDTAVDSKSLYDIFASFGIVLSCKVATDSNGQSRGYGFVQFELEEAAQKAIQQLNGMLVNDKQVYVGLFVRRQERERVNGPLKFTNVYVKNFSEAITDENLKNIFAKFGPITSAVVMKDGNGQSRGFGFINFQNPDAAAAAVEKLHGTTVSNDEKVWYVGRAQRKSEREAELKAKFEQERNGRLEKLQGANLYLKNLDDIIDDEKLKELFSEFGTVTSCKVVLDPNGQSRGSGFVAFSTPEEASHAKNVMHGKIIGTKPLYVAVAQRKEERKARLQAYFAQLRATGPLAPPMPSPSFPGAPRLGPQQLYFGQGAPGVITQPAAYGYQQQLVPGIRPGMNPNYMMPYHLHRQGQPGQRMGVRRGGTPQQMQQQQNANQGFRYMPNARNGVDLSIAPQGLMGPMMPLPIDVNGMPVGSMDAARLPVQIPTLASALASASPEHQRVMLGEQLYPLVERIERVNAGKVTGMLLEMDQTEVLHLVESPDALKKKVEEAMEVLRVAHTPGSDGADQLGALSLND
uniref:Polyadenylate-binding protein n=1 Tax=Anthurium amnicola TaxID=1678845 RepID=A0A1D1XZY9_9ARAE